MMLGPGASPHRRHPVRRRTAARLVVSRRLSIPHRLAALRRLRRPLVFNSLVLSRCRLSSLISGVSSSPAVFPPLAACRHRPACRRHAARSSSSPHRLAAYPLYPVRCLPSPATQSPKRPSPAKHSRLPPPVQSPTTAAHKALGVASERKQRQYQWQYRLICRWEKAKLASALAKRQHARLGDVFMAEEKTQTDPTHEASLPVAADHAEGANRSTAIINAG